LHQERDCANRLRQIGLGIHTYANSYGYYPTGTVPGSIKSPAERLSWVTQILDYQDIEGVGVLFDADQPWTSLANLKPPQRYAKEVPAEVSAVGEYDLPSYTFRCPGEVTRPSPGLPTPLDYVGIVWLGDNAATLLIGHPRAGIFGYDRIRRPEDVKDGLAQTTMIAETTFQTGPWTAGGPTSVRGVDPNSKPCIGRGQAFGGAHRGGAMGAFAEGSVRFIAEKVDSRVFEAHATIAGGERNVEPSRGNV
jgi:Protein of unknown function (DUF1559)